MHPASRTGQGTADGRPVAALAVLAAVLLALFTALPVDSPQPAPVSAVPAGAVMADGHDTGSPTGDGWVTACTTPAGTRPALIGERTPPHAHLAAPAHDRAAALPLVGRPPASPSPTPPRADHAPSDRGRAPPAHPGT
ncbi:hypothetical protein ACFV7R_45070 [Streptomyces sp. NPDC059866]|uniref:hypothetical protein n=1 Tax=Streptomyces sp. NPDC059866 TaxID=3346978 RepID=UPI003663FF80